MKPGWLDLFLFAACSPHPPKTAEKIVGKRPLYDGLNAYFSGHGITPWTRTGGSSRRKTWQAFPGS
jgi:hypothetical protein